MSVGNGVGDCVGDGIGDGVGDCVGDGVGDHARIGLQLAGRSLEAREAGADCARAVRAEGAQTLPGARPSRMIEHVGRSPGAHELAVIAKKATAALAKSPQADHACIVRPRARHARALAAAHALCIAGTSQATVGGEIAWKACAVQRLPVHAKPARAVVTAGRGARRGVTRDDAGARFFARVTHKPAKARAEGKVGDCIVQARAMAATHRTLRVGRAFGRAVGTEKSGVTVTDSNPALQATASVAAARGARRNWGVAEGVLRRHARTR